MPRAIRRPAPGHGNSRAVRNVLLPTRDPVGRCRLEKGSLTMLWTIAVILLILWLLGFSLHIAGGLIHILLVIAVIVGLIVILSCRYCV
jgi:hypothetical protein